MARHLLSRFHFESIDRLSQQYDLQRIIYTDLFVCCLFSRCCLLAIDFSDLTQVFADRPMIRGPGPKFVFAAEGGGSSQILRENPRVWA